MNLRSYQAAALALAIEEGRTLRGGATSGKFRPLVVLFNQNGVGGPAWAWFRGSDVWLLVESDGRWWPVGQEGVGGTVVNPDGVAQLVARFGEPPRACGNGCIGCAECAP